MHKAFAKHNKMRKECENGKGTLGSKDFLFCFVFFLLGEKGIFVLANTLSLSPCFQPE